MIFFLLFVFGLVIGSFLNVVSLRYDGSRFVLDPRVIGGRSHCPHCKKTLRWFELVPLFSFLLQGGRCRRCDARLSVQYPALELLCGVTFALVPWRVMALFTTAPLQPVWLLAGLWTLAFVIIILAAAIDLRTGILPDELNVALGVIALGLTAIAAALPNGSASFLGALGGFFAIPGGVWVSRATGAVIGFIFFEFLLLVTRGKGIGMGDVKLALPLGFLFGYPDILPVIGFAFIFGAIWGVLLIILKKKTIKGALPFCPFLALASAFIFFLGVPAAQWYLHIMGM
jgi:prepilin signal peptidase PulO-like enzyme (type II secretory pathway)